MEIKLGILVVYLLKAEDRKLLDIHLEQIQKNTALNYTIYASVNRFIPEFRRILERNYKVEICPIPTTNLRGDVENEYYLNYLIDFALKDDCTHLAMFHVDSFPISYGWDKKYIEMLNDSTPVVSFAFKDIAVSKPHTGFILFTKDFYQKYKPDIILKKEKIASEFYDEYAGKIEGNVDGGSGFGYLLEKENLNWVCLGPTNKIIDDSIMGNIFDDSIFHLTGNARKTKIKHEDINEYFDGRFKFAKLCLNRLYDRVMPKRFAITVKEYLASKIFFRHQHQANEIISNNIKSELYNDFDSYINFLRTGKKV